MSKGSADGLGGDIWVPAKVRVSEITENKRMYLHTSLQHCSQLIPCIDWLVVTIDTEQAPVVWRVIKDGWVITSDEVGADVPLRTRIGL